MKNKTKRPRKRLKIAVSEEDAKRLSSLSKRIEAESDAETIRRALRLFELLLDAIEGGGTIEMHDSRGRLVSPIFFA